MLNHSDLFPEFGCNGELVELPERCTPTLTVRMCVLCWTEFSYVPDDGKWVNVVYPGMRQSLDWPT